MNAPTMSANYPLRHSLQDFGATQRVEKRTAIIPPRHDGVIILAIVSVFFAGMALGGALFARKSEPMQIASYSLLNAAPPTMRE
jgi:hypothetical protein